MSFSSIFTLLPNLDKILLKYLFFISSFFSLNLCAQVIDLFPFEKGNIFVLGERGVYKLKSDVFNEKFTWDRFKKLSPDFRPTFAHDAYRNALLLIKGNTIVGILQDTQLVNIATYPQYEVPRLVAADESGNIYTFNDLNGLNFIDRCGKIHSIDDQFLLDKFITPKITVLFYHKETHSLFLGLTKDGESVTVYKLPLNKLNQIKKEEVKNINTQASSSFEIPISISYGPMPCVGFLGLCEGVPSKRDLLLFIDSNSDSCNAEARIWKIDPFNFNDPLPFFYNEGDGANAILNGVFLQPDECIFDNNCGCVNNGEAVVFTQVASKGESDDPNNTNPKSYLVRRFPSFSFFSEGCDGLLLEGCRTPGEGSGMNTNSSLTPFHPLNADVANPMIQITNDSGPGIDSDCDGIADSKDNCKETPNSNQEDRDGDGFGDVCDECACEVGIDCDLSIEITDKVMYYDGYARVKVPDHPSLKLDSFLTLEAWIFLGGPNGGSQNVIWKGDNYSLGYIPSSYKTIGARLRLKNGGWTSLDANIAPAALEQKWIHLAASYKPGDFRLYINGALNNKRTDINSQLMTSNSPLYFGSESSPFQGNGFFRGSIDEIRIWNEVRSEKEIADYYSIKLQGKENGLVGYWSFEEEDGIEVIDLSEFKNNGSFQRNSLVTPERIDNLRFVFPDLNGNLIPDPCEGKDFDQDGLIDKEEDFNLDGIIDYQKGETDPYNPDTDNDGLMDGWEKKGITINGNHLPLNQPPYNANPLRKNIFLEIDWTDKEFQPQSQAINIVIDAFNKAPVENPDGSSGIDLFVDYGQYDFASGGELVSSLFNNPIVYLPGEKPGTNRTPPCDETFKRSNFATIKSIHFNELKEKIFHYCLFVNASYCNEEDSSILSTTSGVADLLGTDFIVSLGTWKNGYKNIKTVAGTLMHELGHNLGLLHGGGDSIHYKPNYLSIMNYSFQFSGVKSNWEIDYSREKLPTLLEGALDEPKGIGIKEPTKYYAPRFFNHTTLDNCIVSALSRAIDWNYNGDNTELDIASDINNCEGNKPELEELEGFNDWANIHLNVPGIGQKEKGIPQKVKEESTEETYLEVNANPIANAGSDTLIITSSPYVIVGLNGTESYDPDGIDLSYFWEGSFQDVIDTIGKVNPLVTFTPGFHTATLKVFDGIEYSTLDTINLSIYQRVSMDLNPYYENNLICQDSSIMKIALLSSSTKAGAAIDFDATQIDSSTINLGPLKTKPLHYLTEIKDIDKDGLLDLLMQFEISKLGLSIEMETDQILLSGRTLNNVPIISSAPFQLECQPTDVTQLEIKKPIIDLFPIPTVNNILQLRIKNFPDKKANLKIFNPTGQELFYQNVLTQEGKYHGEIPLNQFSNGVYWLKISSINFTTSRKFLVLAK